MNGQETKHGFRDAVGFRVKGRNSAIKTIGIKKKEGEENRILTCHQAWDVEKMSPFLHNFCHDWCI